MARIAFAWELGSDLGHAMACNSLAFTMRKRGHRVAFMFRELHSLSKLPTLAAHEVFQAPVSISEGENQPDPASLADILLGCGYDRPSHLAGLLAGWFALLSRWKPDLLVADFSPTALLAARVMGLRRVTFSNGFSVPPRVSPLPAFRFDQDVNPQKLAHSDARALATVNGALASFGVVPLRFLADQLETDQDFLATFPELDSYGTRAESGYWGPRVSFEVGADVRWPEGQGKRVAVYIKQNSKLVDAVIDALAASAHRVAAYIPDLTAERAARLRSPSRTVSDRPMRLGPLFRECDLLVSHGGNIGPGALMFGVPQLILPMQYEQFITANRIANLGAGAWIGPGAPQESVAPTLATVLSNPSYKLAARAYAAKYPAYSPAEQERRIVNRMEEIIQQPARPNALPPTMRGPILSATSTSQGASQ
jgi:UDP:flavonoid glycosyltransferase YjiC (YdhE family)